MTFSLFHVPAFPIRISIMGTFSKPRKIIKFTRNLHNHTYFYSVIIRTNSIFYGYLSIWFNRITGFNFSLYQWTFSYNIDLQLIFLIH